MIDNGQLSKQFKLESLAVPVLLVCAFLLRMSFAVNVPLSFDENVKLELAHKLFSGASGLALPIGDQRINHSLFSVYFVKLGLWLFGDNPLAGRIFFVLFGTLSLYFIYKVTKDQLGVNAGLWALALLAFDQFHIGESGQMREEAPLLLFASMAIYFFLKACEGNKKYIPWTGVSLGLGYLCKEIIIVFWVGFVRYWFWCKRERTNFGLNGIFLITAIMLFVAAPYLWWGYLNQFAHYTPQLFKFGLSLRSMYLYFGEIFAMVSHLVGALVIDNTQQVVYWVSSGSAPKLLGVTSHEFPFVHWVTGLLIWTAVVFSFRKECRQKPLVKLCLVLFFSVFFVVSLFDPTPIDSHWRASLTILPGMILLATLLERARTTGAPGSVFSKTVIIYLILHACWFSMTAQPPFIS